jgi:uncharacterized protein YqgC (DUF456 family)
MIVDILLWLLVVVLAVGGIAGLVLPAIPGAPLLFAGLLLAAWIEDFVYVGTPTLIALGVLAALSYALDFIASALGAKRYGASGRAIAGATIGALLGMFFGLPGLLAGPFLGAVIGELSVRRNLPGAARAGFGAFVGLILATAGKLALGFTMIGLFLLARFL